MRVRPICGLVVVMVTALAWPVVASADVIVDTGEPPGDWAAYFGDSDASDGVFDQPFEHSYAARFVVSDAWSVTSIEGWMHIGSRVNRVDISISADGGDLPGAMLHSGSFLGAEGYAWQGLTGLAGWDLAPGAYWVVYSTIGLGFMMGHAPNPLGDEAYTEISGTDWYARDDMDLAVRIQGRRIPDTGTTVALLVAALLALVPCLCRAIRAAP